MDSVPVVARTIEGADDTREIAERLAEAAQRLGDVMNLTQTAAAKSAGNKWKRKAS
jgi:hypothetical protein